MKVLLDTHTLIWAVDTPGNLSPLARQILQDPTNELLVSAASIWEIAIKVGKYKKLILTSGYRDWMEKAITDLSADLLPITIEYADKQSQLPDYHGDPFDRMLIAQALVESIGVVSVDSGFDVYGVQRLW